MDLAGIYGWRGQWCWEQLKRLLPAAGVGVCFGALSFHLLSENALRIMIGLIGLGLNAMVGSALGIHAISRTNAWAATPGWSMIAGFTVLVCMRVDLRSRLRCCLKAGSDLCGHHGDLFYFR